MNDIDRGKLVGMVLGDGYIRTASAKDKLAGRRISPQISFSHCLAQKEYAEYKMSILNKMFGGNATINEYDSTYNGNHTRICAGSKSNPYFKTLKGMIYFDGKKNISEQVLNMLTPEGIALWFMDDGSYRINRNNSGNVSSVSLTISTYCSKEEVDNIINYFNKEYDIDFRPAYCKRTCKWYVRTNTSGARKLSELISPYIIPLMQYKLSCVRLLNSHECHASDKICINCGGNFAALKAKNLCMKCYNDQYINSRKMI